MNSVMMSRAVVIVALMAVAGCSTMKKAEPAMVSSSGLRAGADELELGSISQGPIEELQYQVGTDQSDEISTVVADGGITTANTVLTFGERNPAMPKVADCYMKLGVCRSIIDDGTGKQIPVRVGTGVTDGIWYQKVYATKKFLIFRRSKLMSQTAFTVDHSGNVIDVNSQVFSKTGVTKHWARRVN